MSAFRSILVAVDGSDQSIRAVDVAISLAQKYDSVLTALYVVHIPFGERLTRARYGKEFIEEIHKDSRR
jgi:nucleotide-binding universal stress UspA family protein